MFHKWQLICVVVVGLVVAGMVHAEGRGGGAVKVAEKRMPSVVSVNSHTPGSYELSGTGVIVDDRGYVLTNEHVVSDIIKEKKRIAVGFNDNSFALADLVWQNASEDLALLKVRGKRSFPEVTLGPVDLKIGEPLIAIGHPAGYVNTVTKGIVSKIADKTYEDLVYKDAIQTDTPINGGNSGGPLFNADGELVGINFLKRVGSDGLAWAINADVVQRLLASKCSSNKIAGVKHGIVATEKINGSGADRRQVIVRRCVADGPADKGGLKKGDQILKIAVTVDGKQIERKISNRFDVERVFWGSDPGDTAEVSVLRDEKELVIKVKLTGDGVDRE